MAHVIIIAGPTASGKTSLAVKLAQHLDAPVISADSRQVYKELDIGVAKPTAEELALAPHHLLSYVSIHESYSAGQWSRDAKQLLESWLITEQKPYAIISGGSGLHVKALVEGIPEMPKVSKAIRDYYTTLYQEEGISSLQNELKDKDPAYYGIVDLHNPQRLMRALGAIEASGKAFTELREAPRRPLPFKVSWVILNPERTSLYSKIEKRVDNMVAAGLKAEAKTLYPFRTLDALHTIGYQEWWPHFEGDKTEAEVVSKIKTASRQYAKRQLTWNKKLSGITLASALEVDRVLAALNQE